MHAVRNICVTILVACLFAGCGKSQEPQESPQTEAAPAEKPAVKQPVETTGSAPKQKPVADVKQRAAEAETDSAPKDDSRASPEAQEETDKVAAFDPATARQQLESIPVFSRAERVGDIVETPEGLRINYKHTGAPMKIHDHYRQTLRAAGWKMGRMRTLDDGGNAVPFSKDGQTIMVVIGGLAEHSVRMLSGTQ